MKNKQTKKRGAKFQGVNSQPRPVRLCRLGILLNQVGDCFSGIKNGRTPFKRKYEDPGDS